MVEDICVPPADWAPRKAIWTAWPSNADLWVQDLTAARKETADLIQALAAPGRNDQAGDRIRLLVDTDEAEASARARLGASVAYERMAYGDIWLRDTAPIFSSGAAACAFRFNGWGEKYQLDGDADLADRLAAVVGVRLRRHEFVLEGGAVEMDGEGTLITTRECLLSPNRNPGSTEADADTALERALGVRKVIWLDRGLLNDHTDGHVDNLARFVAPRRVVVQNPVPGDPNAEILREVERALSQATDAAGRRLQVVSIPSPGRVVDGEGASLPASHLNFVIGRATVVVPTYRTPTAEAAVSALAAFFPGKRVVGLSANALLTGGGAFHCITREQPL